MANLVLALGVLWRRHSRTVHFIFVLFGFSVGGWTFSNFLISLLFNYPYYFEIVGRLAFAMGISVAYSGLLLSWHFPEDYHPEPSRKMRYVFLLLTVFIFFLCLTPLIQESVDFKEGTPIPRFGSLYLLYVIYMLTVCVFILYNLFRSKWKTRSGRDRMQVNYCLAGLAVTFIGGYFCNFALPQLTDRYQYYLLGSVWPLAWTSLTAYAICRYRLMDIGVVLRNLLIYAITTLVLLLCILLPYVLYRWFMYEASLLPQVVLLLGAAGVGAFYLPRFEKAVTFFVDHRIFHGRYDYETAMVRFVDDLRRAYGRRNISSKAVRQISIIVQSEGAAVFLPQGEDGDYEIVADCGLELEEVRCCLSADGSVVKAIRHSSGTLTWEDIIYMGKGTELDDRGRVEDFFERYRLALAMALVSQGETLGFLFIGEKSNDNVYSIDDIQLIEALASQLAFALDNTRLYEQLLASERLYETVLSHMQRGVVAVDADMRVTMLNNTAREMFGVNEAESKGCSVEEILSPFGEILCNTIERRRNQGNREIVVELNEKRFPCECETSIMQDGSGSILGALLVCQDLTERKKFEEDIRRMDRLASIGTLAAGVAHEIKNPLVSIQTFAQLLPERYQDPDFRDNFGKIVYEEITRINQLIHNLLHFARPPSQGNSKVDLHELIDRTLSLLKNEMKKNNIQLETDLMTAPAIVMGDAEQLYQVFINIMQNAIQFAAPDAPKISIVTRSKRMKGAETNGKDGVEIIIVDNGIGIEKEALNRIFDPFFSTRDNGSGLGLAICHGILKNHQADIDVRSVPGQGVNFAITIPRNRRKK